MFYDIFTQLCEEKGVRPAQVARELSINQSTISMWKSQGTTPSAMILVALAEYFNTTPAYLMGNKLAKTPDQPAIKRQGGPIIVKKPDPEKVSLEERVMAGTATPAEMTNYINAQKAACGALSDNIYQMLADNLDNLSEEGKKKVLEYAEFIKQREQNTKEE